jgi:hypothetical protein
MATAAEVAREQCGVVAVAGGQMTIAWSTRAQLGHNSLQLSFLKKNSLHLRSITCDTNLLSLSRFEMQTNVKLLLLLGYSIICFP